VAQGKLPPVEERLPSEPLVLQVEEVGKYGGIIRRAHLGPADANCNVGRMNGQGLARWSGDGLGSVPMAFSTVDTSADGNVWTVHLLPGMKWSDGAPFTADDFLYKYEVLTDRSIGAPYPVWIKGSGDPVVKVLKVDDSTVEFRYSQPYYLFWLNMSLGCTSTFAPFAPAHYLKQFNANYNPDAEKVAKAAGFETWEKYYLNRYHPRDNPDRPAHSPFRWTTNGAADIIRLSRNPYYQYVDQEGNQLPYIDRQRYETAAGTEILNLRAAQGEVDFQGRHLSFENFTVLKEGEERGGYTLKSIVDPHGSDMMMLFNVTYAGPEGVYLNNKEWRRAASMAIDRDSIIEITFGGQGLARNSLPAPGHPYYPGPEYETKYAEYEPDMASEIFGRVMGAKDSEGFHTLPNGDRFEVSLTVADSLGSDVDGGEQICNNLMAVGVRCRLDVVERSLMLSRGSANELMMRMNVSWETPIIFINAQHYLPINLNWGWGSGYSAYRLSDGKEGTEIPPDVQHLLDIFAKAPTVPPDEQAKIAQEIFRYGVDNQVFTGIVGASGVHGIFLVKDDLVNVPDWFAGYAYNKPFNSFPEQFWYRSEENRK
jgi:peptide/nickel transport system substrate-binding protein